MFALKFPCSPLAHPQDVDVMHVWRGLLAACETPPPGTAPASVAASRRASDDGQPQAEDVDMGDAAGETSACE